MRFYAVHRPFAVLEGHAIVSAAGAALDLAALGRERCQLGLGSFVRGRDRRQIGERLIVDRLVDLAGRQSGDGGKARGLIGSVGQAERHRDFLHYGEVLK